MKTVPMQVTLLDRMGSDLTVCRAARVSFDKETDWEIQDAWDYDPSREFDPHHAKVRRLSAADAKLIAYLARHKHWTPFGHCFLQFRIKAPIFVARQLVKHQVGLVWNEVSRRYVDSEPEFWFPEVWRGRPEGSMKQGSSGEIKDSWMWTSAAKEHVKNCLVWYEDAINAGVAPEQARMILPLNTMTEWYWSGSLAAFARVCQLRLDPHAQAETSEIAQHISDVAATFFPVSWAALIEK